MRHGAFLLRHERLAISVAVPIRRKLARMPASLIDLGQSAYGLVRDMPIRRGAQQDSFNPLGHKTRVLASFGHRAWR
jgi:hypothetical protein